MIPLVLLKFFLDLAYSFSFAQHAHQLLLSKISQHAFEFAKRTSQYTGSCRMAKPGHASLKGHSSVCIIFSTQKVCHEKLSTLIFLVASAWYTQPAVGLLLALLVVNLIAECRVFLTLPILIYVSELDRCSSPGSPVCSTDRHTLDLFDPNGTVNQWLDSSWVPLPPWIMSASWRPFERSRWKLAIR